MISLLKKTPLKYPKDDHNHVEQITAIKCAALEPFLRSTCFNVTPSSPANIMDGLFTNIFVSVSKSTKCWCTSGLGELRPEPAKVEAISITPEPSRKN